MENNGLILNSHFVPPEILARILCLVDPNDLTYNCRLVCRNWNEIIIEDVWKLKMQASNFRSFSKSSDVERKQLKLPWHVYYHIYCKDPFEKNLLLNNCGQNELRVQNWYDPPASHYYDRDMDWYHPSKNVVSNELHHWYDPEGTKSTFLCHVLESMHHDWRYQYQSKGHSGNYAVEPYPIGADPLPDCDDFGGHKSCFVTSYTACVKEQTIDLVKNGLSRFILDTMQPTIVVSEWFSGRSGFIVEYQLTVSLISSDGESVIQRKEVKRRSQPTAGLWKKVSLEFKNYDPGVRFVAFKHRGRTNNGAHDGFNGAKMAGGVVKVTLSDLPWTDYLAEP